MANPTVRGNLKKIEDLQKKQAELEEAIARSQTYQTFIAKTLAKVLGMLIPTGIAQDFLTHRGKWKQIVSELEEVTNAENTEERQDGKD